eukprot:53965-Eustigmatos_ZCMA.PRE.1
MACEGAEAITFVYFFCPAFPISIVRPSAPDEQFGYYMCRPYTCTYVAMDASVSAPLHTPHTASNAGV